MAFTEEDSGIIGVVIPFEQKDTGEPAEIVWVYNLETGLPTGSIPWRQAGEAEKLHALVVTKETIAQSQNSPS